VRGPGTLTCRRPLSSRPAGTGRLGVGVVRRFLDGVDEGVLLAAVVQRRRGWTQSSTCRRFPSISTSATSPASAVTATSRWSRCSAGTLPSVTTISGRRGLSRFRDSPGSWRVPLCSGSRLSGGRQRTQLVMRTSPRSRRAFRKRVVEDVAAAAPTNGSPCSSSRAPGASPTNKRSASSGPAPLTMREREATSASQRVQSSTQTLHLFHGSGPFVGGFNGEECASVARERPARERPSPARTDHSPRVRPCPFHVTPDVSVW